MVFGVGSGHLLQDLVWAERDGELTTVIGDGMFFCFA
jgi:hypothetical protein